MSVSRHHVALRNIIPVALLWLNKNEDVSPYQKVGMSENTVQSLVMDVYTRVFVHVSEKIGRSTHIVITIDSTSDLKERNPIAIRMTGIEGEVPWSFPIRFCEPGDHKAKTQLREIEQTIRDINHFNTGKGLPSLSVFDIEAITFDTTSSNTGKKKGLAGLLTAARKEEWENQNREGEVPELVVKGCEDHLINLMSKDYEEYLVTNASKNLIIKGKHRATDIVQLLINKVARTRRSFRDFMSRKFGITKMTIPRISNTRFLCLSFIFKFGFFY